jgi:hypothetical protein
VSFSEKFLGSTSACLAAALSSPPCASGTPAMHALELLHDPRPDVPERPGEIHARPLSLAA